jgi:hypothetical protein
LASAAGISWTEAQLIGDTQYGGYVRGIMHVHGCYWLIYDLLPPGAIAEDAWLSVHFSHRVSIDIQVPHAVVAAAGDAQLLVASSQGHRDIEPTREAQDPMRGWVSLRYGDLTPASTFRIPTRDGPKCVATLFQPKSRLSEIPTLDVRDTDEGAVGVRIARGEHIDYLLLSRQGVNRRANFFDIDFEGTALWLRTEASRPTEVRTLASRKACSESLGFNVTSREALDLNLVLDQDIGLSHGREDMEIEVTLR